LIIIKFGFTAAEPIVFKRLLEAGFGQYIYGKVIRPIKSHCAHQSISGQDSQFNADTADFLQAHLAGKKTDAKLTSRVKTRFNKLQHRIAECIYITYRLANQLLIAGLNT